MILVTRILSPVKKLWNGDYGLAITFWLLFIMLLNFVSVYLMDILIKLGFPLLALCTGLIMIIYIPIILVGIWNAANKYKGAQIWANLAKTVVALNIVAGIGTIIEQLSK